MIIRQIRVTPVAFRDPPLLNAAGVHEPWALRTIVEVITDQGLTGLGETYGDLEHLGKVRECAQALIGLDVHALNTMYARISAIIGGTVKDLHGLTGAATKEKSVDRVFSPFEVACLDIRGKAAGVPVSDLLGGTVRDAVPYSAYLFYKWAGHPGEEPDRFGAALDEAGIVEQTKLLISEYGFESIKLKGGVFPPDREIAAIRALHEAFPDVPLRLDPNAAWSVTTSIRVGRELEGVLQYLEDPTPGIDGMAEVAASVPMPLATNMCVVTPEHFPPAMTSRAIGVLLLDHHYWGGLVRSSHIAAMCDAFGLAMSMHSNSHLGISLAAMTHLAAATPNLTFACDTHTPWQNGQDVVAPGALRFVNGAVPVPTAPGLGVDLDRDALAVMSEQYEKCGIRARDDTSYLRRFDPSFSAKRPRW
ncbi:glucarate dehydratase [Nonomuraea sp. MG754425]|uniref:glucarate dehydratase family protein n=1 Tax=Nonomuraea sp. MG754425 TaxID=2570319 RepID=UPI0023519437|nr:glucarate dehydratase family protein [Nonomuraea sp. MG754425]MCF6474000.1 glucarate dehydratase [Nonomuraea sp. MG754425]